MIELTADQHEALASGEEFAPDVVDPQTNARYVLLSKEVYDRIKNLIAEDDARLMAPLLADLDAEDWQDAAVYEGTP